MNFITKNTFPHINTGVGVDEDKAGDQSVMVEWLYTSKGRWCMTTIVPHLLAMVTCKETRAAITALHKMKVQESARTVSWRCFSCRIVPPPVQSLSRNGSRQVWVHLHAQRGKDFWRKTWCQGGQQRSHFSPVKTLGIDWYSAEGTGTGLLRTGAKSFSLMNPLSNCLGHLEEGLFREDEVSATISPVSGQQQSILRPFTCGVAFRSREWTLSQSCLKTAMKKEWYQNVLWEQILPTIHGQFGDEECLSQHDGACCHKAKVITKWLVEQNIKMLDPWPGNYPDLNPIENLWSILKRRVDNQKPTNSDKLQALIMQELTAINQDLVHKLIDIMPGRIAEVLKKKGRHCKYWLFPQILCNSQ